MHTHRQNKPFLIIALLGASLLASCSTIQAGSYPTSTPRPAPPTGVAQAGALRPLTQVDEQLINQSLSNIRVSGDILMASASDGDRVYPIAVDVNDQRVMGLERNPVINSRSVTTEQLFAYTRDHPDGDWYMKKLHVYNVITGEETVIGGTGRWLHTPSVSGHVVAWSENDESQDADIHVYDVTQDRAATVIRRPGGQLSPKIEGDWVIYMQRRSSDPRDETRDLVLYNLNSQEEIHIGPSPHAGRLEGDTYGIANGRVVWIGWRIGQEPTSEGPLPAVYVYDLVDRFERPLDLLTECAPHFFKMAGDLILVGCSDGFYGYDLVQDRLFPIPHPRYSIGEVYLSETQVVFRILDESSASWERDFTAPPEKPEGTPPPARFRLFVVPITRVPSGELLPTSPLATLQP